MTKTLPPAAWPRNTLRKPVRTPVMTPPSGSVSSLVVRAGSARVRPDGYRRRMESNLRRDAAALEALRALGLEAAEVADLGLGLRDPYARTDGAVVSRVLCYPLADVGGRARFGCVNIDGITANPEDADAWSAGDAATVRRGSGDETLVVADTPIAVWRLGFAAARAGINLTVVASSKPGRMPAEWGARRFWGTWKRVLVSGEVSAVLRDAIATVARRPLEVARAAAPTARGSGARERDDDWLADLMDGGVRIAGGSTESEATVGGGTGDFAAEPVALHGGFSRGRMLYPFRVERRSRDGAGRGRLVHSYETLVLRADGAILEADVLPAPAGTPAHRRVHALSDGTRILAAPEPSRTTSWSLQGVRAYAAARLDGVDPCRRAPADIMADVHAFIASRVALPRADDLWIASGFVAVSHMFRVFPAIPLLLVEGERGSGKSELAGAVAMLGFNATVMGQGSAAALVRLATDCGGLVVLDDVERLAGDGGAFGELAQCLKTGYKAVTARKAISSPSGRVQVHDFFGPRLITTTQGVDPVLYSRCIGIATAADPAPRRPCDAEPTALRDELHALAMSRAEEVAEAYARIEATISTRGEEIVAPLLAIAEAFGCGPLASALASRR
ncbi:hypothetical protein ACVWZA_000559 [Sphingomonas sp. UYAg733]